ncbi:cytosolic non-specific dipeptidase-like [Amblyomma americanum]
MSASSPREDAATKSHSIGPIDEGIPRDLEDVFDIIENSKSQMLTWLKELVAIPSVSAEKQHNKDIMRAIDETKTKLQEQGLHVTLESLGDQKLPDGSKAPLPPLLLGATGRDPGKKTLCIYGHLDVSPAHKEDGWSTDPFHPTERDGRLFGRGAADDKGPLVAWIGALSAFSKSRVKSTPVNVKFVIDSTEEVGSPGLGCYLAANSKRGFFHDINFACISDGFWLTPHTPSITYGLRGICHFQVEVAGSRSDLHSGIYGGTTLEAMSDLVHLLDSLMGPRGHITVEGIYDDVAPITDMEWKFYEHVNFDPDEYQEKMGIWNLTTDDKVQLLMRRWRYPALSIHGIEGAHWSPGEKAVIPGRVVGRFSIRTVPNQTGQKVADCVTRHLEREFAKRKSPNRLRVTMTRSTETWLNDRYNSHFKAAAAAMRHAYGLRPDLTREGGTVSAATLLHKHVCSDMIMMSMTPAGRGCHSIDEHIRVEELVAGAKLFAAYMYELSKLA